MKSMKFFLMICLMASVSSISAQTAATIRATKTYYKPAEARVFSYHDSKFYVVHEQKVSTLTTNRDSVLYNIDTITVAANESGIIEVQVIGYNDSASIAVTGKQIVRYKKVGGTLTLGTPSDVLAIERDGGMITTGIGGATFSITAASNQIYIKVKGKAPMIIRWESLVNKQKFRP